MDWGIGERGPGGLPTAAGRAVRQRSGGGTAPPGKRGPPGRLSGRSPTAAAIGRDDFADGDAAGRAKKKPDFPGQAGSSQETNTPCREAYSVKFPGRSPGFWLLTNPLGLPGPAIVGASGLFPHGGFRGGSRQSQWRDHAGFTPASLFSPGFYALDNAGATWGLWAIRLLKAVGYRIDCITGLGWCQGVVWAGFTAPAGGD